MHVTERASFEILIAEDDANVRNAVARGLRLDGYTIHAVGDGVAALEWAMANDPDLVILDIGMPVLDGLRACRRLRTWSPTLPILMLTARHEVEDRIAGLDAGADDYLVKPFALGELAARVRALLRRTSVSGAAGELRAGDITIDVHGRTARRGQRVLDLTRTEFDLLELLVHNVGIVLTRETLYDRIWGIDFETDSRSLDVHVSYLRSKTEAEGETRRINTVRGIGYVIRKDPS